MDFVAVVDQVIALLRQRGRVTYSTLKRHFQLDDAALAVDERGNVLVWTGAPGVTVSTDAAAAGIPTPAPLTYTPPYLAEKILTSKSAMEGERKQGTVLFADLKGSMELLADRDPEEAPWTWPHHCVHIWELVVPHLPSGPIDFKGLARGQFCTSL